MREVVRHGNKNKGQKLVVGLVGSIASGKGVACQIFQEQGFRCYSLSDQIRIECRKRELGIKTETLRTIGDGLRKEFGVGELVRRVICPINKSRAKLIVIDGIRNPGEINLLRKKFNVYIIGITTPFEIRFQRHLEFRKRQDIKKEFQRFKSISLKESGVGQKPYGQQLLPCIDMADEIIENDNSLEDFERKVRRFVRKLKRP